MLTEVLKHLGYREGDGLSASRLACERSEAVAQLREICAEHGDNDWPDNLHLADILEKHLARYLDQRG